MFVPKSELILLFISIALAFLCLPSSSIKGGRKSDITEEPWTVAIFLNHSFCAGSILSKNYVLTSAQCVFE